MHGDACRRHRLRSLSATPAGRHLLQATGAGFSSSSTKATPASQSYDAYSSGPSSGKPTAIRLCSVQDIRAYHQIALLERALSILACSQIAGQWRHLYVAMYGISSE